jgi:erythromycin esterase
MKFHILSLLLLVFTLQCYSQVSVIIKEKNEIVYPITPNETTDFSELLPIKKLFYDKKVVGMGEATHGTREFFNMKVKMFKFLAVHYGYRIFSIEATYGGTLKVNDYVLYGKGDALSAMKGMEFWTCDTEEVKELIEWIKATNEGKPEEEKLKFYGFDCQSFKGPTNALMDYVKEFDKQNLDEFVKGFQGLNDSNYLYFYTVNPSNLREIAKIHAIISFLQNWFHGKENLYISGSGRTKFELARHNIENLKQTLLIKETPEKKYDFLRDSCMAQNIKWIYELEKTPVFVWAHNGHIGKTPSFHKHVHCMGMFLNTMYGADYYNIGFVFSQGSFQAYCKETEKVQECSLPKFEKNTLTNELSLAGIDAFFIDLTTTNNKLFRKSTKAYWIGGGFAQEYWNRYSRAMIAKKQFDGLIFINTTTCVVPINRKLTN